MLYVIEHLGIKETLIVYFYHFSILKNHIYDIVIYKGNICVCLEKLYKFLKGKELNSCKTQLFCLDDFKEYNLQMRIKFKYN